MFARPNPELHGICIALIDFRRRLPLA
jgi:hypothetical protein